jgi:uncharacterized protein with HEPN domain
MSERSVPFLLGDIKESIDNILLFTSNLSFEIYQTDLKTVHAVQHNFMIIGEAVARMPDGYKQQNVHINWRQIKDFRNIIVHDYFGIDSSIVWDIIRDNLPGLQTNIADLLLKEEE